MGDGVYDIQGWRDKLTNKEKPRGSLWGLAVSDGKIRVGLGGVEGVEDRLEWFDAGKTGEDMTKFSPALLLQKRCWDSKYDDQRMEPAVLILHAEPWYPDCEQKSFLRSGFGE